MGTRFCRATEVEGPVNRHPTVLVSRQKADIDIPLIEDKFERLENLVGLGLPEKIPIDVKLAPLILLLWRRGIETCFCCQEETPGVAYISFPGTCDVMAFLFVVQRPYEVKLDTLNEFKDGKLRTFVHLTVFFPTLDIPHLICAFKAGMEAPTPKRPRGRPRKKKG